MKGTGCGTAGESVPDRVRFSSWDGSFFMKKGYFQESGFCRGGRCADDKRSGYSFENRCHYSDL